jgi:hypothetical protein
LNLAKSMDFARFKGVWMDFEYEID